MGPEPGTPYMQRNDFGVQKFIISIHRDDIRDVFERPIQHKYDHRMLVYVLAASIARMRTEIRHASVDPRVYYRGLTPDEHISIFLALGQPFEQHARNEIRVGCIEWARWVINEMGFWPDTFENSYPFNPANKKLIDNMMILCRKINRAYGIVDGSASCSMGLLGEMIEYAKDMDLISKPHGLVLPPMKPIPILASDPRDISFETNKILYFMLDTNDFDDPKAKIKAGITSQKIIARLRQLRTGCPRITLYGLIENCASAHEKYMHNMCADARVIVIYDDKTEYHSEWFEFGDAKARIDRVLGRLGSHTRAAC